MQMFKVLLVLSLFSSFSIAKEIASSKTTYIYDKDTGDSTSQTTWIVEESDNNLHIQGTSEMGNTLIITTLPLNMQSFSHQSKQRRSEYQIHRSGPLLYAHRTEGSHSNRKEFNIGRNLWVQEFDFSFRPFILSTERSLQFYIIHPQKLSLHRMVATKYSRPEQITINGKTFHAIKTKVTLTGFKKMFWKAELWFEQQSGDLLKYMANEGPNTPMSVITLVSKSRHGELL